MLGAGDGFFVALLRLVELARRLVEHHRLATRRVIAFGVIGQRGQHGLDASGAGAGFKQRCTQFAFALDQLLPAFAQAFSVQRVQSVKLLPIDAARQRQQHRRGDRAAGQRRAGLRVSQQQRVFIAFAPRQPQQLAGGIDKSAGQRHLAVGVEKIVFALRMNAIAQVAHGPQCRRFTGLVGAIHQVQLGAAAEVQHRLRKRAKGVQKQGVDFHQATSVRLAGFRRASKVASASRSKASKSSG